MKKKKLNSLSIEKKRIKWSSFNKTIRAFFITITFLIIFTILVILFSWLAGSFLDFISN